MPTPPAGPVPVRPNPPRPPNVKFNDLDPGWTAGLTPWAAAALATTDNPNHVRTSRIMVVLLRRVLGRLVNIRTVRTVQEFPGFRYQRPPSEQRLKVT